MWIFLLGLFLGTLLGLNYSLVINQLSSLLGIPKEELLQIHGEAPKSVAGTVNEKTTDAKEDAPCLSRPDLEENHSQEAKKEREDKKDQVQAPREPVAEDASNESIKEGKEELKESVVEAGSGQPVKPLAGAEKLVQAVPETKKQELEVEVLLPNWIDFPLRRPQIQFQFQSEDGKDSFNEIFELGEKRSVRLEPDTQYSLHSKMIKMSTMVKPFNWSGRFNPSTVFSVGQERLRVTYLTPRTLRNRANLKIEAIAAAV
ncbi:MAG: hypothetical protein P1V97_39250 [Planctomycetota bacterium]|nr:hypothetical protein [Planctomycetota bacterium]